MRERSEQNCSVRVTQKLTLLYFREAVFLPHTNEYSEGNKGRYTLKSFPYDNILKHGKLKIKYYTSEFVYLTK